MKNVHLQSIFWFVFSNIRTEYGNKLPYSVWVRTRRIRTTKTPYTDTFYAAKHHKEPVVCWILIHWFAKWKIFFLMKTLTEDCLKFPTTNPHWFDCISRKRLSTRTVLKKFLWLHLWRSSNIKVGLSPSKIVFLICFNDSPSKMMKNEFYCILKALFVLKIFKFLSWHFGHVDKAGWLEG